jgi:hypothetical protein
VRHHLEAWGYPAAALAALPPAPGAGAVEAAALGARPLLLALGWALHRTAALQHAFLRKHRKATVRLSCIGLALHERSRMRPRFCFQEGLGDVCLPPYPFDVERTASARAAGAAAAADAEAAVADAALQRRSALRSGEAAAARVTAHHALLLQGRARGTLRQLATAAACRAGQVPRLAAASAAAAPPGPRRTAQPLTPFQLHVLRSPQRAAAHAAAAAAAEAVRRDSADFAAHATALFAWLDSALDAHLATMPPTRLADEALPPAGPQPERADLAALAARAEAELGARRGAAAALSRRWQALEVPGAAARAALEAHAAVVDAALPPMSAFLAAALATEARSLAAAAAASAPLPAGAMAPGLPPALLDALLAAEDAEAGRMHALPSAPTELVPAAPAPAALGAGRGRPLPSAPDAPLSAAAELARLEGAVEAAGALLARLRLATAASLREAVAPFDAPEFVVSGFP